MASLRVLKRRADLPHVGRRLDRGNVLEDHVCETDDANNGARDDAVPAVANNYGANEDVDCE